jgi:putative peptidoglycan lipid II flippase
MTLGLRLVFSLGLPAGVGLILLANPIARLLFQRGHFQPEDTLRVAQMIAWYASGVWAYCTSQVIVRGFYALSDAGTPARVAAWMVGLNLVLNLTLIWPMAETGMAASTAFAASVQTLILVFLFSRRHAALLWKPLLATVVRTILASLAMACTVYAAMAWMPAPDTLIHRFVQVIVPISLGVAAYCGTFRLLGGRELGTLVSGRSETE